MTELHTERLLLRHWRAADGAPFAALNADPVVMQFMAGCLTRSESDAWVRQAREALCRHGFGPWALELKAAGRFIGCVGLALCTFEAPFTPCVEILWRLQRSSWGHGYATEAARACMRLGFEALGLCEIVAFTVPANARSRALMQRLGMQHDPNGDFEHPRLPAGHPLRHHVLYRLNFRAWAATQA